MLDLLATILKYLFAIVIYLFIFGIMRLIYLDIRSYDSQRSGTKKGAPYLKLVNQREKLDFKVEETYSLYKTMSIGRLRKNSIVIKDPFISGNHAQFVNINNKILLKDLGSTNGTFLNGTRMNTEETELRDWDKITIGQLEFIYVSNTPTTTTIGNVYRERC